MKRFVCYLLNKIDSIKSDLETILYDEQEVCDNIPENFILRHDESEEACDIMDESRENLEEICNTLKKLITDAGV